MMNVRVSAKGQIVIPTTLRRKYGIKHGTRILVIDAENTISLKPITEQSLRNLQGSLKGKGGMKVLRDKLRKDEDSE